MSKKSIERKVIALRRNLRKNIRIFDYLSMNNGTNFTNAIPIDLSNVAESMDFVGEFDLRNYAKNVAPPYEEMFFEFHGFPLRALVGDAGKNETLDIGVYTKCFESFDTEHDIGKWMIECFFIVVGWTHIKVCDNAYRFWVSSLGEIVDAEFFNSSTNDTSNLDKLSIERGLIVQNMGVICHGLSLMNAHNVELVDYVPSSEVSTECKKQFGIPLITFKTLKIKSLNKKSNDDYEPKEYQGLMRLHLRRGSFAHYTDDAPLFGKYTGMFWRPATAVGEARNGTVIKDYKVIAS